MNTIFSKLITAVWALLCLHVPCVEPLHNQIEQNAILDLMDHIGVRYCIFVVEPEEFSNISKSHLGVIKEFSAQNHISNIWNVEQFTSYLQKKVEISTNYLKNTDHDHVIHHVYQKTAVIINHFDTIRNVLMRFNLIDEMSKFTWLVFDYNRKLSIPYDCEFIEIRQIRARNYEFIEHYTNKNVTFENWLGNWDNDIGLHVQNISKYWRRLNLKGTIIDSVSDVQNVSYKRSRQIC